MKKKPNVLVVNLENKIVDELPATSGNYQVGYYSKDSELVLSGKTYVENEEKTVFEGKRIVFDFVSTEINEPSSPKKKDLRPITVEEFMARDFIDKDVPVMYSTKRRRKFR